MLRVTPPDEADVWPWAYASLATNSVIPHSAQEAKLAKPRRVSMSPLPVVARLVCGRTLRRAYARRAQADKAARGREGRSGAGDAPAEKLVDRGRQGERIEDQLRVDRNQAGAEDGEGSAERDERAEHLVVAV